MQEGRFTYGYGPGEDFDRAHRAAVARDNGLTLDEQIAASGVKFGPMETTPDGALIPAQLAGHVDGWAGDRSHAEGFVKRIEGLYARMDEHRDAVREAIRTGARGDTLISRAVAMSNLWDKIARELEL